MLVNSCSIVNSKWFVILTLGECWMTYCVAWLDLCPVCTRVVFRRKLFMYILPAFCVCCHTCTVQSTCPTILICVAAGLSMCFSCFCAHWCVCTLLFLHINLWVLYLYLLFSNMQAGCHTCVFVMLHILERLCPSCSDVPFVVFYSVYLPKVQCKCKIWNVLLLTLLGTGLTFPHRSQQIPEWIPAPILKG